MKIDYNDDSSKGPALRQALVELQKKHHDRHYRRRIKDGTVQTWLDLDNADSWANTVCLEDLRGFLQATPRCSFVTIADGKGGKEARFIDGCGHDALPTDLCIDVLAEAKAKGLIRGFSQEDALALSFADDSFDFALVKESLHHFPQPYKAIYEMLRVACHGAILIEPRYALPRAPIDLGIKACMGYLASRLLGLKRLTPPAATEHPVPPGTYEEAGNFVYQFSAYELMQTAMAMGIGHVAYISAHHVYEEGFDQIRGKALARLKKKKEDWMRDFDQKNGRDVAPLLTFLFLKQPPSNAQRQALITAGFRVHELPQNPYVSSP